MYGNGKGIGAYQRTDVMTSEPKRLVLMCYDAAIRNLKAAKEKNLSGEYEAKALAVQKTQDIIGELSCSLDLEKGGQIARNLQAIYNYMTRRLLLADSKGDFKGFDEVAGMIGELKATWEAICEQGKRDVDPDTRLADPSSRQHVSMACGS
jgi:flagellar protein FliS